MPKSTKPETAEKRTQQLDHFKEAARALGYDEDEVAFDEKLAEVAKHKPAQTPEPEKK